MTQPTVSAVTDELNTSGRATVVMGAADVAIAVVVTFSEVELDAVQFDVELDPVQFEFGLVDRKSLDP